MKTLREHIEAGYTIQANTLILYSACQYRWDTDRTADPEIDDYKYFVTEEEALAYAKQIKVGLGFHAVVEKITYPEIADCEMDTELGSEADFSEIWRGAENEGENLDGAILVCWSWRTHVGYSRKIEGLLWAGGNDTESSIGTGNVDRVFRNNYSVLLNASDIAGLDAQQLRFALEERLGDSMWKWNSSYAAHVDSFIESNF